MTKQTSQTNVNQVLNKNFDKSRQESSSVVAAIHQPRLAIRNPDDLICIFRKIRIYYDLKTSI